MRPIALSVFALLAMESGFAIPAYAQTRMVPTQPANAAAARDGVEVFVLNEGSVPAPVDAPSTIDVTAKDGTSITLERVGQDTASVAPGGFAKLLYRAPALISLPATTVAQNGPATIPASGERSTQTSKGVVSAFVDRFEPHDPIYGVFGLSDAGAKLQFSFAFRPFERAGVLDHVRLAYTQTMFWAIGEPSGPFRSTNYAPSAYYEQQVAPGLTAAGGYAHNSNGGGVFDSVDLNRIFVRADKHFDLGRDWSADVAPEAWFYVGKGAPGVDIQRYWGYASLHASVQRLDGVKLALDTHGNPATGKGSAELFVSYPLHDLGGGTGIYLFGQAFTGYGEALDDFDRSDSRARLGIALTR